MVNPIRLAVIHAQLRLVGVPVVNATGENSGSRKKVEQIFAWDSHTDGIALCSDALNEGLNLQGAAALVHFDLPTARGRAAQRAKPGRRETPRINLPLPTFVSWADEATIAVEQQIRDLARPAT